VEEPEANQLMKALNLLSEDIQNKQEVIKKLENLRIEFVANVSHELKTPLTSIRGYTETLVNGAYKDSETCLKFLKRIEENSEKLSALISDLLDLSRLETFPNDLNWQKFPSQNITEKLEGIFFPVLSRTEHKMYLKFQDPVIEGDRKKLEQVFLNLIDNAIRYTPSGTLIELVQSSDQNDWIYKVKDNGPGIPQEHLPRIFERFYTIDQARTKDKGGTGLGLAIVKHIILAHGGSIEAESPPGQGTQFIFKIPKKESFNIKKS
jgi:signal transduction histidine kinase